jgi:putative membrane protein
MALFSELERKQIAQAIADVETSTSGELVVVHTARSDDYALFRAAFAFFLSLGLADMLHFFGIPLEPSLLLLTVAALGTSLFWVSGLSPLLRLLVPGRMLAQVCMQRALRAMIEEGVTETRDRSGVLIFLSEAEHRVVILADRGINERVEEGEWDRDVQALVGSLKRGNATAGLIEAIARIGSLLTESFPPREDDTNELLNEPREV